MSYDLINEIKALQQQLEASVKKLRENGTKQAQAEMEYRIALTEEIFRLKDKGEKATLIELIARGNPKIAKLRYERDVAEAVYSANQEAINSLKIRIRVLDNQIAREWGANDNS